MAEIVLGIGTSHGPMLTTPWEQWDQRVNFDKKFARHAFKDGTYNFDQLVKLRAANNFEREITREKWQSRYEECQSAISRLADVWARVKPDAAVIIGNDQMELFTDAAIPAFSVYWGETIENRIGAEEEAGNKAPGVAVAQSGRIPPEGATYQGMPALGRHIIEDLMDGGFDVASLKRFRPGRGAIPHAYGFVYRKIMRDQVVPSVPVVINTFYPPNTPKVRRCWEFGRTILKSVQAWPENIRVALIGSGGLTHFVIDEEVDRAVLDAIRSGSVDPLEALGEPIYREGTSEVKNWIALMGAMADLKWKPELEAYVPCYRSLAGTGNAMGFVHWHA
jgi:3-O-methylgallate 3,4-dioxygenase